MPLTQYYSKVAYSTKPLYGVVPINLPFKLLFPLKNKLVQDIKLENKMVIDTKTSNKLVKRTSMGATYYERILAGMPQGLLLALTYPVDQDGVLRT